MNIRKIVPDITRHIDEQKPSIRPDNDSHRGLCVPEIMFRYGSVASKAKSIPYIWRYLSRSIRQMNRSYRELYRQPEHPSVKITETDLEDLASYARTLGVSEIGFADVDPHLIFAEKRILFPHAIVLVTEMGHDIIRTVPSKEGEQEILRTYYSLNVAANKLKRFLNERGYRAEAGPALGGEVNYPLLAEKAGLGAVGKHGLLITPSFGPSLRLAAVYTEIENLPIAGENPHLWVRDFCERCNRCIRSCPAGAIYPEPHPFADGSLQRIDYKKCAVPFSRDHACTVCIRECTFFRTGYEKVRRNFAPGR